MAYLFAYVPSTSDGRTVLGASHPSNTANEYRKGYREAVEVKREMEAMQADWDWKEDFILYALSTNPSDAYMKGVRTALA